MNMKFSRETASTSTQSNPIIWLDAWLARLKIPQDFTLILPALLVGVGTGLGAVFFIWLLEKMSLFSAQVRESIGNTTGLLLIMGLGGLLVGYMVDRWAREAKGHGVPEVMEAIALKGGHIRPRVAAVKVLASTLTIGAGGSAGREGPIVQVGSALGSTLGQWARLPADQLRTLVACGAAAGIAATFNAPIAGAIFALEVILQELHARNFGAIVISAVSAGIIGRIFLGEQPAFNVPQYALNHLGELLIYLILGVLAALVAVLFIRLLYGLEGLFDNWKIPMPVKTMIGMWLTAGVALLLSDHQVLGPGLDLIGEAISDDFQMSLGIMFALLVLKLLATTFTLGAGNSGGVFAPALFMGAVLGGIVGRIAQGLFPGVVLHPGAYAIVGMAAVFAGAARAPITAILIVFEMSGDYRLILPLMFGTVIATLLAEHLFEESIYTLKLKLRGITLSRGQKIDLMQSVTVGEAMSKNPDTVPIDMPLKELIDEFERTHHHGLPVVNETGELVGVVSIRDLEQAISSGSVDGKTVRDIATTDGVMVAYPDEPMWMALRRLGTGEISVLPVVDRRAPRRLVGVVRRRNVVHAYNQAIAQQASHQHRAEVLNLGKLDGAGFIQVEIPPNAPVAGRRVKTIELPPECLIVSIRRKRKLRAVHGDTILSPGDLLTIFTHEDCIPVVRQKLTGQHATGELITEKQVETRRIAIPEGAQCVGKSLQELTLPPNCILSDIVRDGQKLDVQPALKIMAGDVVRVVGEEKDVEKAAAYLTS